MALKPKNSWQPNSASVYRTRLEEYKEVVIRLVPSLPQRVVDSWFISPVDAMVMGFFLEHYPRRIVALDIGTFVGGSAFCFAGHPKVTEVVSVDPNPALSDEISDKSNTWGEGLDLEPLEDTRVLDVARAAFTKFDAAEKKVRFHEGVVGSSQVGIGGGSLDDLKKVEVPEPDPSGETGLVALVDGLHTREGVRADLEAIFGRNPHAVALLDDCRRRWGPFVQAGVVDFMEQAEDEYRFQLFGDLGLGLTTSSLGIFYPEAVADEIGRVLEGVSGTFSQRLDPLRLLGREEELIATVNKLNDDLAYTRKKLGYSRERITRLEALVTRFQESKDQLAAHYSSRRYKLLDAATNRALRIPGFGNLVRRNNP